jgi:hypothetical protein
MKKLLCIICLASLLCFGCHHANCNNIPAEFSGYDEAIADVRNATFDLVDSVNTSESSFVTGANYYSCDGQTGFLIVGLKGREYIHKDVPIQTWQQFKQATSFGEFYAEFIRGRYRLDLK